MRLAVILLCGFLLHSGFPVLMEAEGEGVTGSAIGRRLDLLYVSQVKEGCGSASLAMLLAYWSARGHAFPEELLDVSLIHRTIYSEDDHGSRANDVEAFLQRAGLRTFVLRGRWSDLEEHIAQGRPMLVALRAPVGRRLHYAVVTGVSSSHVLLHDPAVRPNSLWRRAEFENHWKASGYWTLLALPAQ